MNGPNPYKTHSSKIVYENRWMKVHEDQITHPSGSEGIYGYIEVRDSVAVVAQNQLREIFLIKQFLYPTKIWLWGLPGGGGEIAEKIIDTSKRELAEETGLVSDDWKILGKSVVYNGLSTEWQWSLLADNVRESKRIYSEDANEISDGKFFSEDKIREMIQSGEIADNQTLAALELLFVNNDMGGQHGATDHSQ